MADSGTLPEGAVQNHDGTVTLPLLYPVEYKVGEEGNVVDDVTIRRPKMADTLAIKAITNPIDLIFSQITRLTGQPEAVVKKFDEVDVHRIVDVVEGFSKPGRATGSDA